MNNNYDYVVSEDMLLPMMADALVGHFGQDINTRTPVFMYLNNIGLTPGEIISCDAAVTAWAMAMLDIRDLSSGSNLDDVYDLAGRLSTIA